MVHFVLLNRKIKYIYPCIFNLVKTIFKILFNFSIVNKFRYHIIYIKDYTEKEHEFIFILLH